MLFFPFLKKNKFSVSHSLILHFTYHKAMTVFFNNVFRAISEKFNIYHTFYHKAILNGVQQDIFHRNDLRIISLNDDQLSLANAPKYKGTHLIRDPRDLLVSGYRYHKYCKEAWALAPFTEETLELYSIKELGLLQLAEKMNYQQLINHIDIETGYLLELNLRKPHFEAMLNWNYQNPNILELRYENIFDKEIEVFRQIFKHYGFNNTITDYGLKIVENFSFKNLVAKGNAGTNKHANTGITGQWKDMLPSSIQEKINNDYCELLEKLKY